MHPDTPVADDKPELAAQAAQARTLEQLRAREALLSEAEHLVRVGSYVWEPGRSLLWSDELYRLLGLTPGIPPSPDLFYAAVHPDDRPKVIDGGRSAAVQGILPSLVYRIIRRDTGEARYVRGAGCVYRNPDGTVHRIVGTLLDVTESTHAALALEQAAAVSCIAEELSNSGSFVVRLHPFELTLSDGLRRITGLERNIDRASGLALLHPDDHTRVYEWWSRSSATRRAEAIQLRIQRPNGEVRHLYTRAIPVPFSADGSERIVGAVLDVTDRVRLEADLQRAAKLEAVGTLAAGVAHDFNNYLMIISSALEHLPNARAELHSRLLDNARHAISRCAELTRQLLGFARCQPVAAGLIDVRSVIERLEELFRQSVGRRARLRIHNADRPLLARIDAQHLEQMLANLIVNAADAIEATGVAAGEVRITGDEVELTGELAAIPDAVPAGRFTRIRVEDNGGGVAPEHLPRIFEPYFTTKPRGRGTGLGLSAVYGVAHQNGGRVTVEALPNGTRFALWFRVPAPELTASTEGAAELK